jgi:hypothetical protein
VLDKQHSLAPEAAHIAATARAHKPLMGAHFCGSFSRSLRYCRTSARSIWVSELNSFICEHSTQLWVLRVQGAPQNIYMLARGSR